MNRIGLRVRKKKQVRRALYLSALDLFREHGYQNTSVDMIAASANQSRSTFFNYYKQKEEILFKVTDNGVRFVSRAVEMAMQKHTEFESAFHVVLADIARELKRDKLFYAGVFQEIITIEVSPDASRRRHGISRICKPLSRLFAWALKNGELSFPERPIDVAELFFGTLFTVCLSYVYAERVNLEKSLRSAGRIFAGGLSPR